jgi:TatD DNase family protein
MYLIDTHAHLDMIKGLDPREAVERSAREGVKYIINVGSSMEGSRKSVEYSRKFSNVYASIGLHPHYAEGFGKGEEKELERLAGGNAGKITGAGSDEDENSSPAKVVAVGETGFDFYRNLSPGLDQERAFAAQIELALKHDLPVIIHDRDAHKQTIGVVKEYVSSASFRAVVHCFSGDVNFALKCLELGLFISFTGVITFPNAENLRKVVKRVPLERMFVETDSPFLAPQEKRGKENYPGYVRYIAQQIAGIKEVALDEVARITSMNAENFFKIGNQDLTGNAKNL